MNFLLSRSGWWLSLAAVGVITLLSGFVQINQGERGLVARWGRPLEATLEPGLHWLIPLGVDRLNKIRLDALQSLDVGVVLDDENEANPSGRLVTGDQNLVLARFSLKYTPDPSRLWDYLRENPNRERILAGEAESFLAVWAAAKSVDSLLLEGRISLARDMAASLRASGVEARLGILLGDVTGTQVSPPREVQPSFDLVSRSESNRFTLITRAQQDVQTQNQVAQSEAYRTLGMAQAEANAARQLAKKDAERFALRLKALRDNPDRAVHFRQIWEEETSKILSKLKEQGRLGFLDEGVLGENAELFLAPFSSQRNQP